MVKMKHKRYVFQYDPPNGRSIEQPKHVLHEAGPPPIDSRGHPGLAQILTGKTSGDDLDLQWEVAQIGDVALTVRSVKPRGQYRARRLRNLAEHDRFVPDLREAELKTADSREKTSDLHGIKMLCRSVATIQPFVPYYRTIAMHETEQGRYCRIRLAITTGKLLICS